MSWKLQLVYGLLFVVLIALQVRLWFGDGSMEEVVALKRQLATQQAEVDDLKSGLAAIEARARSELGLIREGETYFQLLDPQVRRDE